MYGKKSLVVFAAVVLLASASVARAHFDDDRDASGLNAHQTQLDEQYARSHPTVLPGTPARPSAPYAYVPPHRPAAKHRHRINH